MRLATAKKKKIIIIFSYAALFMFMTVFDAIGLSHDGTQSAKQLAMRQIV